jgi:hypothetical protein
MVPVNALVSQHFVRLMDALTNRVPLLSILELDVWHRDGSSIAFNQFDTFSEHMRAMKRFTADASAFLHLKQVAVGHRPGHVRWMRFTPLHGKTLEAWDPHYKGPRYDRFRVAIESV